MASNDRTVNKKKRKFQYGNYRGYYGYRFANQHQEISDNQVNDPRVKVLKDEWFRGKKCLDIGCNAGILTIAIARKFQPAYMLGIDLDLSLVSSARNNLRLQALKVKLENEKSTQTVETDNGEKTAAPPGDTFIPLSFKLWKTLPTEINTEPIGLSFPLNTVFKCEDFVLDEHSGNGYDVICSFSVTKWIHLQHGDEGLKAAFIKIYNLLSPGGIFILEPQKWKSYHNSKYTSKETEKNYKAIQFKPHTFCDYLVQEVGFESCQLLDICRSSARGFNRPIYQLTKPLA